MTDHEPESLLAGLPDYEPGRECRERIRSRCHAALAKRADRARWRLVCECAAAAVVGGVYLAEVVRRVMTVYGL